MTRFLAVLVIFSLIVCNHLQADNDGICVLQNDTAIKKSDKDLSPDSISMQKNASFSYFDYWKMHLKLTQIILSKINTTLL